MSLSHWKQLFSVCDDWKYYRIEEVHANSYALLTASNRLKMFNQSWNNVIKQETKLSCKIENILDAAGVLFWERGGWNLLVDGDSDSSLKIKNQVY